MFNAIVLAADRGADDPVATAARVPAKCLTPISGVPMLVRVVDALVQSQRMASIVLCGPDAEIVDGSPELRRLLSGGTVRWIEHRVTPSRSAAAALETLPEDRPVLLTTCDHALLSPDMVRHFLDRASASGDDVAFALAAHELVRTTYPETRRTVLKFKDGNYCSCNLFAFLSQDGRRMAKLWQRVEQQRKSPVRVISLAGWATMALYALGWLSLEHGLLRLSRKTGIRIGAVTMPFAGAAIDVDTAQDLDLVRNIVARAG